MILHWFSQNEFFLQKRPELPKKDSLIHRLFKIDVWETWFVIESRLPDEEKKKVFLILEIKPVHWDITRIRSNFKIMLLPHKDQDI